MNLDKIVMVGELFQIYSSMLTERQREVVSLYYEEDYSLGEISDELGVSRQSVFDTLKRSEKVLEEYESKLKLLEKFRKQNENLQEALNLLTSVKKEASEKYKEDLDKLEELLRRLLA